MAKRDMMKIYDQERSNVPDGYGIGFSAIENLVHMVRSGDGIKAINVAFVYGFALGRRAEKNHAQKKRSSGVKSC